MAVANIYLLFKKIEKLLHFLRSGFNLRKTFLFIVDNFADMRKKRFYYRESFCEEESPNKKFNSIVTLFRYS